MDAKKCDRCGRFYSEYGKYKAGEREFEVKKSSTIRTGTKTGTLANWQQKASYQRTTQRRKTDEQI